MFIISTIFQTSTFIGGKYLSIFMAVNVLVIGSGGREHALCSGLNSSPSIGSLYCSPGNAGTAELGENISLNVKDHNAVVEFCKEKGIGLVVVGPEAPLCDGISDTLMGQGILSFGPESYLANLEGSKAFAKEIMHKAGVPTAEVIRLDSNSDVDSELAKLSSKPWVIKRDVLAGGKGVLVTENKTEAKDFIQNSISTDGYVLLESFLEGEEASMLVVMDKNSYLCLPASQDHKRVSDGDLGLNTGGMGAYCPAPVVTEDIQSRIESMIVKPMHQYFSELETPYRGVLYVGLMIDNSGMPSVVEFNVRFGDPECQVTIPLIDCDLVALLSSACQDKLSEVEVSFHNQSAICVVLASEGYPASPIKGRIVEGLVEFGSPGASSTWINPAGLAKDGSGNFIATGGRVLTCTSMEKTLEQARNSAYTKMQSLRLEGSHYRTDIGHRAL